ncbi:hypothetical protein SK128_023800 [Halocaridina rubra]|uniref:Uncharacterized protein n=1 Tax=Halocaridina rubra TaxID=373956 RepID=A0AAN8ZY77_HALRR
MTSSGGTLKRPHLAAKHPRGSISPQQSSLFQTLFTWHLHRNSSGTNKDETSQCEKFAAKTSSPTIQFGPTIEPRRQKTKRRSYGDFSVFMRDEIKEHMNQKNGIHYQ